MRVVLILILINVVSLSLLNAGTVFYNGSKISYDDAFSLQSLSGVDLSNAKLNGKTIYGSCFSKEIPDTHVFPDNMIGVTFVQCNLDNVFIPLGNFIIGGSQRRFKAQNDLRDWEVDQLGNPTKILNQEIWIQLGYSTKTADIPLQPIGKWEDAPKSTNTVIIITP